MILKDREAIITGAAQGIGAAFSVGFSKEGAKVVIADIHQLPRMAIVPFDPQRLRIVADRDELRAGVAQLIFTRGQGEQRTQQVPPRRSYVIGQRRIGPQRRTIRRVRQ